MIGREENIGGYAFGVVAVSLAASPAGIGSNAKWGLFEDSGIETLYGIVTTGMNQIELAAALVHERHVFAAALDAAAPAFVLSGLPASHGCIAVMGLYERLDNSKNAKRYNPCTKGRFTYKGPHGSLAGFLTPFVRYWYRNQ